MYFTLNGTETEVMAAFPLYGESCYFWPHNAPIGRLAAALSPAPLTSSRDTVGGRLYSSFFRSSATVKRWLKPVHICEIIAKIKVVTPFYSSQCMFHYMHSQKLTQI